MKTHLSSRFITRTAAIAITVALSAIAPAAVANASTGAVAVTAKAPASALVTNVQTEGGFTLGERSIFRAEIRNGSTAPVKNATGLITVAYGKHVNAALEPVPADLSKVTVEQVVNGERVRLPLTRGQNGALQATYRIAGTVAPGGTATERFAVRIERSIPATVDMGEVAIGAYADGSHADAVGFGINRNPSHDTGFDAKITGVDGAIQLALGGKPVEFDVKLTNRSGRDQATSDFFFVMPKAADLDPEHVTVERLGAGRAWRQVKLGSQDQSVLGNLDSTVLKNGATRTYTLRLGLTKHFPKAVKGGRFAFNGPENTNVGFDFTPGRGGSTGGGATGPETNRELKVSLNRAAGAAGSVLAPGGAAKELTATVTNRGNISQRPHFFVEVTDENAKRRLKAGELRVEQYVKAAGSGWKPVRLADSKAGGHLVAEVEPRDGRRLPTVAPGASVTVQLRIAATKAVAAKGFAVALEARAERSSTRASLPYRIDAGKTAQGSHGTTTATTTSATGTGTGTGVKTATGTGTGADASGRLAKTGGGSSTPLLIGATGMLVAGGAGALLIARRRAH
ncbi:LAETG motif-containing sortase-dependent surface protein [Streptomyces sp. NPDC050504]|uniref:LAETG motif-containing sortase-dependent surface protein n=1 Tax=Streptomyces sp. NPDC050504 TaxID=3365618 RepID=UPI0037B3037A